MTCSKCYVLQDTIRGLELELGVRRRDGELGALMVRFGLLAKEAMIVSALYNAKGRVVATDTLLDIVEVEARSTLRVHLTRIRAKMAKESGAAAVTKYHTLGYGLSPVGMSMVLAAVQPPEMQRDREA